LDNVASSVNKGIARENTVQAVRERVTTIMRNQAGRLGDMRANLLMATVGLGMVKDPERLRAGCAWMNEKLDIIERGGK